MHRLKRRFWVNVQAPSVCGGAGHCDSSRPRTEMYSPTMLEAEANAETNAAAADDFISFDNCTTMSYNHAIL